MHKVKFLDLEYYNKALVAPMQEAIAELMETGDFIKGQAVNDFVEQFAQFHGVNYGVPCGNGTDALEIILQSISLEKNATIVVPDNTFIATAEAVVNVGHKLQLCNFDARTQNLCPKHLNYLCETGKVDAVIFVHLYGNTDGVLQIAKICERYDIPLIEDCAQAHGAKYNNISVGNFGIAGAVSFYPGKVLGGIGDAGMIMTNSKDLYESALRISDHGRLKKFDHERIGRNSRMDTIQAKYLIKRLSSLSEDLESRENCRKFYCNNIDQEKYIIYEKDKCVSHGNHLFPIRTRSKSRYELSTELNELGIPTGCHYPQLLSETGLFFKKDKVLSESSHQKNILSLPIGPHLTQMDLDYIVKKLNSL